MKSHGQSFSFGQGFLHGFVETIFTVDASKHTNIVGKLHKIQQILFLNTSFGIHIPCTRCKLEVQIMKINDETKCTENRIIRPHTITNYFTIFANHGAGIVSSEPRRW